MIRILMLRLLVCTWLIPVIYIGVLPLAYLMSGDFKKCVIDINEFVIALWYGKC